MKYMMFKPRSTLIDALPFFIGHSSLDHRSVYPVHFIFIEKKVKIRMIFSDLDKFANG